MKNINWQQQSVVVLTVLQWEQFHIDSVTVGTIPHYCNTVVKIIAEVWEYFENGVVYK